MRGNTTKPGCQQNLKGPHETVPPAISENPSFTPTDLKTLEGKGGNVEFGRGTGGKKYFTKTWGRAEELGKKDRFVDKAPLLVAGGENPLEKVGTN